MNLTDKIKKQISDYCSINKDIETCVLILDNGQIVKCLNNKQNTNNFFKIAAQDYLLATKQGKIVACFHSHVGDNDNFSLFDHINCKNHKIIFILYNVNSKIFKVLEPEKTLNFIGRDFNIISANCYTLIQDYYKEILNIEIPNVKVSSYDWTREWSFEKIEETGLAGGFQKIENFKDLSNLKVHDVLIFNFNKGFVAHFSIYLGGSMFIHHPRNAMSHIQSLDQTNMPYYVAAFRYKDLI